VACSECNCDTITTSGDVDYVSTSVTLTFDESSTRVCGDISITPDDIYEDDETFSVTLTTGDGDVTLEPDSGVVTITDEDGGLSYTHVCYWETSNQQWYILCWHNRSDHWI